MGKPRVLLYDLETSEVLFAGFGTTWKPTITRVVRPSYIYMFSYMWYEDGGENIVNNVSITDFPS